MEGPENQKNQGNLERQENQKIELEMMKSIHRICTSHQLPYSLAFGSVLGAVRHQGFIPWDDDIDLMVGIDVYDRFCRILQERLPYPYRLYSRNTTPGYEFLFARVGLEEVSHKDVYIDLFPMVGLPASLPGRWCFVHLAHLMYRGYFLKQIDPAVNYQTQTAKRRLARAARILLRPFPASIFTRLYSFLQQRYPIAEASHLTNFCGIYGMREVIPSTWLSDLTRLEFEGLMLPVPMEYDAYLTQMYGDYRTPKQF